MKKIELLAPAGSFEALQAAISAGCDAVYLGGAKFGARAYASNFNDEEMITAIKEAHIYGVKVYVTINTLLYDHELGEAIRYINFLYSNDVDAIIIQDLGLLRLARNYFNDLELHASTQMSIHNLEGIKFLERNGISRVVLARENTIEEIRGINQETSVELEVFIHGALCISYSGQCLMSGLIGGRSGNRGRCAQPCRKQYRLNSSDGRITSEQYYLSTKDLNTLEKIPELIAAGVHSFKIEGRMKKPEYVYTVVKAYRDVIDQYMKHKSILISDETHDKVTQMFNRSFTKGFLFNANSHELINLSKNNNQGVNVGSVIAYKNNKATIKLEKCLSLGDGLYFEADQTGTQVSKIIRNNILIESAERNDTVVIDVPKNVTIKQNVYKTHDLQLMKTIKKQIDANERKVLITGIAQFTIGCNPILIIKDDLGNTVESTIDFNIEVSKGQPVTREQLKMQLNKLGNTPFVFNKFKLVTDENIFIPKSVINKLRRHAIQELVVKRQCSHNRRNIGNNAYSYNEIVSRKTHLSKELQLTVYVRTKAQLNAAIKWNLDVIYVEEWLYNQGNYNQPNIFIAKKRIDHNPETIKTRKHYLLGQLGDLLETRNPKTSAYVTNHSLNITNSEAINLLVEQNIDYITVSHELSQEHYQQLQRRNKSNLEVIVFGYQEAMITKHTVKEADSIEDKVKLVDPKEEAFPVYLDEDHNTHILNSKKLVMVNEVQELKAMGYKRFRLEFTNENEDETKKILEAYSDFVYNDNKNKLLKLVKHYKNNRQYTRGYYHKTSI